MLFEEIEQDVIDKEKFVQVQTEKIREMHENYLTMLDYSQVLRSVGNIIPSIGGGKNLRASLGGGALIDEEEKEGSRGQYSINEYGVNEGDKVPLIDQSEALVNIAYIAGTIEVEEKARLKKLLFRATRGKALTFFDDFDLPTRDANGRPKTKAVYIVVFQEGRQIRDRIVRICDSFMG